MSLQPNSTCDLSMSKTITRWDEALPLGNGLCGALIWGKSNALRFSLDRGDIWDTTAFDGVKSPEFTYETMVRMANSGDVDGIRRVFDAPYNHPLPSKLPCGKLIFDFKCDSNVKSHLALSTASANVQINDIEIKCFMHATQKCGFIHINKPLSDFSYKIENPEYSIKDSSNQKDIINSSVNTSSLKALCYPAPKLVNSENTSYFTQQISTSFSYGLFVKAEESGGETTLCFYVSTSNDGEDWCKQALVLISDALNGGYNSGFSSHSLWWQEFWSKSSVSLPDIFFEKNWYIANYLLASCSRKGCYPMPLQGVWTADDGALPPWKGDYHHDLNTQMSYYSYLKSNHISEGESFIDYLWNMRDCARKFAKSYYNADGICMPSTMSLDGAPLGGWGMYSLSPTNQLWLCQAFERHFRFTGDEAFLREKAYWYLSESAAFIMSLLKEKNGLLYLPVSSSPEIHDDLIESFVTPNSNYDLSLMRYLFTSLIELSDKLQNGEKSKWQAILQKLPLLSVSESNVLMISPDECLNQSHRHFSHAMSVHPLRLLPYDNDKNQEIIDATILDLERLGTGYWVGFSFTWMAEMYAVQKNGNGAAYQLEVFWRNFCSQNGFHLNGDYKKRGTSTFHYRPFTLEANMCAADALQEMLLQSENASLTFFPAIPEEWQDKDISFTDFRAENGLLVSASMLKGKLTSIVLKPKYSSEITINNYSLLRHLSCCIPIDIIDNGNTAILALTADKEYHLN
ncbi:MAG: hypothetical protein RR424_04835 [Oscillospiraceae bacterium]